MKKILFFLIIFQCILSATIAQNVSSVDHERYWYYRNRLKYFIIVGDSPGESCISGNRNKYEPPSDILHYGENPLFSGWYMGVLATEFRLLAENHQDPMQTMRELYYAMQAYIRLDKCEDHPYWNKTEKFDGFFMRDDVTEDFSGITTQPDDSPLNEGLVQGVQYPNGHPSFVSTIESDYENFPLTHIPHVISIDQAIHILLGMALVKKCMPYVQMPVLDEDGNLIDLYNFNYTAQIITDKIILYIQNYYLSHGPLPWTIYTPTWGVDVVTGQFAQPFSYGFARAGTYITGTNYAISDPFIIQFGYNNWQLLQFTNSPGAPTNARDNDHMKLTLAAIGNSWVYPFLPSINTTYDRINSIASLRNWETFYTLLWQYLHDKNKNLNEQKIINQITSAPCEGPYEYSSTNYAPNGWASSRRFLSNIDDQNGLGTSGVVGNFNGLDYMLLYNLYKLEFNPIGYKNMVNRKNIAGYYPYQGGPSGGPIIGNDNMPAKIKAFDEIEATNLVIDNMLHDNYTSPNTSTPENAKVSIHAGKRITFKSGFKAKRGAYLHAYTGPFSCASGGYHKSGEGGLYSKSPMFTYTDSLYCAQNYHAFTTDNYPLNNEPYDELVQDNTMEDQIIGELQLILYPNPNNGIFIINALNYNNEQIVVLVTDMHGKQIYNNIFNGKSEIKINLSAESAGIYYVNIYTDNKTLKSKMIIE